MFKKFIFETQTEFKIDGSAFNVLGNLLVITIFEIDYQKMLLIQERAVLYIIQNPSKYIFIFCSHPNIFTLGRGLQKQKNSDIALVDFDEFLKDKLIYDTVPIKRGGGLTFHYSSQLVFYPIININYYQFKIFDFMLLILEILKQSLSDVFKSNNFFVRKDLLGLWIKDDLENQFKIASMGLAASRYVTYHGLALNFGHDELMFSELKKVYPCGLPPETYSSLEKFFNVLPLDRNDLIQILLKEVDQIIVKQRSSAPISSSISSELSDLNLDEMSLNTEWS
jgi:lipoate-protein ligase B